MGSGITAFLRKSQEKIADKPEKEFTPLDQRVQSMAFITERLLETLADLCDKELKKFKDIIFSRSYTYDPYSHIPDRVLQMAELLQLVFLVVQTQGRESMAMATSALVLLGRTDLVQRLSDCSAEPKDKHLDEHQSGLSHKMATMVAVKELLLEILEDFQDWDLKKFRWFLQLTYFEKGLPHISFNKPESSGTKGAVALMMKTCGQQSVEVTMEVFRDMNRTDLVQKLLASSSEHKEKQSVAERWPALIQKQVESMASVTELLLETLADLRYNDFEYFKLLLSQIHCHKPDSVIPWSLFRKADLQDAVLSVVQTYGQQAVEKTVEFLKEMNKTDLAQMLSDRSSKPQKKLSVNEGRSPLIQKVAIMAAVKQLLLEALNDLGNEDIKKFEKALTSLVPQKNRSFISWRLHKSSDRADIVEVLVDELGQKSVEVTRKLFMDMKGTDLVQKWSEMSSEKLSVDEDEDEAAALKREEALAAVHQILLETLTDLSHKDMDTFCLLLPLTCFQKGLPEMKHTEPADKLVARMVEIYGLQSVEVTKEVFMDMKRNDLVQRLSDMSSATKGRKRTEKLLIETLTQLRPEDFAEFKSLIEEEKHFPLKATNTQDLVELLVETYSRECVEVTRNALMKMNRTDLVQRFLEKQFPPLTQRVQTMTAAIELLLETLADLSDPELEDFKLVHWRKGDVVIEWSMLQMADVQDTVFIMVQTYGHQSVQNIMESLKAMKRMDLAQRLSDSCSQTKKKHLDEHLSALINKVAAVIAVKELLLETLEYLSYSDLKEFKWFLQFTLFQKGLPQIPLSKVNVKRTGIVDVMVKKCGQQCVELFREVFRDMDRIDLVQMLLETSTEVKEKHSVDERWPALIHKVETMASVIEMLLETLADLSNWELEDFKMILSEWHSYKGYSAVRMLQTVVDLQDTVFLMVQIYGQQSLEGTINSLKEMNKNNLAQRLSDHKSGTKKKHSVEERHSALIHKVATVAAVKHQLSETLNDLGDEDLEEFKRFLESFFPCKNLLYILQRLSQSSNRADIVELMVDEFGWQSVKVTREVFIDMNRTDLVQKISETSSGSKEKLSVDEHRAALLKRMKALAAVQQILLETLNDLSQKDFKKFTLLLTFTCFQNNLPKIWTLFRENAQQLVHLMVIKLGQQSVELTRKVLTDMKRTDLVQKLSDINSGSKDRKMPTEKLLAETLDQLSPEDFAEFSSIIEVEKKFPLFSKSRLKAAKMQEVADLMVETYGPKCVEVTRKALMKMNRTELLQTLSEKLFPPLTQRVESMVSVIELLLETLADLSDRELGNFKEVHWRKPDSVVPQRLTDMADLQDTVFLMVKTYSQQSAEMTMESLKEMKRTDLAQRLSDSSLEPKKKHLDEHLSALIHKVATMVAVKELLLEALEDLSEQDAREFKWFLQFTLFQKAIPQIPLSKVERADRADIVDMMVETCGKRCVEVFREVFSNMDRIDLVQMLSETSSEVKEKHPVDERWPALIQKVETMESVIELLLETLAGLSDSQLEEFKLVHWRKDQSSMSFSLFMMSDLQDVVFLMVQTYGQQSVEKIMVVLKDMKRTDLAQRLSDRSSDPQEKHSVDDRRSALIHTVATMTAVKHLLLETLDDLLRQLSIFEKFLASVFPRKVSYISWKLSQSLNKAEKVDLMVEEFGLQSVQMIREGFIYLNKTNLVQKLPESSSGSREKLSVDEHRAALLKREEALEADRQILFETLKDLSQKELNKFSLLLPFTCFQKGLPQIKTLFKETTRRVLDDMVDELGQQSVEVIGEVLTDMSRTDLVQKLSESSSGLKGQEAKGRSELEGCGSLKQDSTDWTKLEPEVNGTDADEAPTYSLQSEAGHFECSVSGLRWVCKEKASFQYQFGSWEGHMERMESRGYMPAGPLMDVALTAGKLNEVHLPHWICTDDIPDILDKFAVLHIDDCGDVVEKVSEVTPSHVKLIEPIFSPRAVLMKVGIPVKISCNVLIYQTNTAFLTLHVYLVPRDPGLQQVLRQREMSHGYKAILKPDPEKSLKMLDRFTLTADGAEICPPDLKLRYPSGKPNFFEVYTENPDGNFQLKLTTKKEFQPVWSCTVRKAEYQSVGHVQENHFVDKHRVELIQRVSNVGPILDELLKEQVIHQESYDRIRALPTSQEKIRELYNGPLKAGSASKDVFYQILQTHERRLVNNLC